MSKLVFGPLAPNYFLENRASSLLIIQSELCKKSDKLNVGKYENFSYWRTDGMTDGAGHIEPVIQGEGPKKILH